MKLTTIRKQLEQMYQQLEQELGLVAIGVDASGQSREAVNNSSEDTAVATVDFERQVALQKQKMSHLAEIERSLYKLENGSYGVCDNCGEPIEQGRLEVLPYATLCVKCKAAAGNRNVRGFPGITR